MVVITPMPVATTRFTNLGERILETVARTVVDFFCRKGNFDEHFVNGLDIAKPQ